MTWVQFAAHSNAVRHFCSIKYIEVINEEMKRFLIYLKGEKKREKARERERESERGKTGFWAATRIKQVVNVRNPLTNAGHHFTY